MMHWLALAILTAASLANIHLGSSLNAKLEAKVTTQVANHTLMKPDTHTGVPQPSKVGSVALELGARSAIAQDVASNAILYQKNANQQVPIASITKLATALVILQHHKLDEVITVPTLPAYSGEDEVMGLAAGQKYTVGSLLHALLVASANDAADALALSDSGTIPAFSAKMNRLIATWGLEHTRYNNPSGLVDEGNYSSASDLVKIAKLALTNPTLRQIVTESESTITDTSGTSSHLTSTNKLLSDPRFHGIKTGFTNAAGQSVVALVTINGHEVVTVILGSNDRFGETVKLADWLQKEYIWQ
jgi:D-alanyl-D-alanine carboxypeptidase